MPQVIDFSLCPIIRRKSSGELYYYLFEAVEESTGEVNVVFLTPGARSRWILPKRDFMDGRFEVVGPPGLNIGTIT